MHELGVLMQAVKTVDQIAQQHKIKQIKHMTLEIGEESGFLPVFFEKLFPVAVEHYPVMKEAQLKMELVPGRVLKVKDIGY